MVSKVVTGYGARLDRLRVTLGLTITQFAEKADVKASSMSLILREVTKNPSVSVFASLSKNTNANLTWMTFGEGEMLNTSEMAQPVHQYDEDVWEYLRGIENRFINLIDQLSTKDSQIKAKDYQIEKLLELLGKPEGAIVEPLLPGMESFDSLMNRYRASALGQVANRHFFLAQPVAKLVAPRCPQ